MRITDWSSDVCYSDLGLGDGGVTLALAAHDPDLPLFAVNVQAHGTGRTDDHATGGINVVSVEILHLLIGDLAHLVHRHRTDLVTTAGLLGTGLDVGGLLQEEGHRRGDRKSTRLNSSH